MTVTVQPAVLPSPPRPRRHVSARGYWLGALLTTAAVIGAVCWALVAFFDYQHTIDRFTRTTLPGVATVQVTDPSTVVVFVENARGATTPYYADLGLTVTDPTGGSVPVSAYTNNLTYDVPGHDGRIGEAVAKFSARQPGTYQLRAAPIAGLTGSLAIGRDFTWDVLPHALGAGGLFLLGGGAGVVVIVITAVRRSSARRDASA